MGEIIRLIQGGAGSQGPWFSLREVVTPQRSNQRASRLTDHHRHAPGEEGEEPGW